MEPISPVRKILIVKTSALGDVVQSLYVLSDLRRWNPKCELDWLVDERFADIPRICSDISHVHVLATRRWRKCWASFATWKSIYGLIRSLRQRRYDLAVDLQGLYKSSVWCRLSGASRRLGWDASRSEGLSHLLLNFRYGFGDAHGLAGPDRALIGCFLGYDYRQMIIRPPKLVMEVARGGRGKARFSVAIFFATSNPDKMWPLDHWCELINRLAAGLLMKSVTIVYWGARSELVLSRELCERADVGDTMNLSPAPELFSLGDIISRLRSVDLVIGVDSGLTHLAALLGLPTVMIFGHTRRRKYSDERLTHVAAIGDKGEWPTVEQVLAAVSRVMEGRSHE